MMEFFYVAAPSTKSGSCKECLVFVQQRLSFFYRRSIVNIKMTMIILIRISTLTQFFMLGLYLNLDVILNVDKG